MALETVDYGTEVSVNGETGYVVRSVAVRGGVEYMVCVADPDAPANETLKIPPAVDPIAHEVDNPEEYERREKEDKAARKDLERALRDERKAYTAKEQELFEADRKSNEDNDQYDAGVNSHSVSAEATRQVEKDRAAKENNAGTSATSSAVAANKAANANPASEGKRNR